MEKRWKLKTKITKEFREKFPEQNPVILQLLQNRGLDTQKKIDEFLNPDYSQDLHDPFLFSEMKKVVKRILTAVEKQEKIVVHGDYDADGVCSAVILMSALKELGAKNLEVYLPHREKEGYGLNKETVKELVRKKTNLIITSDCGISNKAEIALAKKGGIEVIVTDHHLPPLELPLTYATINPHLEKEKYPFSDLSGSGVAFKVVQALVKQKKLSESFEKWLLDLVAVATIADCCPLLYENRTLVRYGMIVLAKSKRVGFQALAEVAGTPLESLDSRGVAFQIAPRLNAAGRMDHANSAFKLLMEESKGKALELAKNLNQKNQSRQKITDELREKSRKQIQSIQDQKVLFAQGEGWPLGIIGIVAGKIADEFHRPTLVFSITDKEINASGRSIDGFDIMAAISQTKEFFSKFGGHDQACGFTLKEKGIFEKFKERFREVVAERMEEKLLIPALDIEGQIDLKEVNWELLELIEQLKPFGEKNPKPQFLASNLEILGLARVGQNSDHLRLLVNHTLPHPRKIIAFGFGHLDEKLNIGDKIDAVFEVDTNEWNGSKELQLKAVDLRLTS